MKTVKHKLFDYNAKNLSATDIIIADLLTDLYKIQQITESLVNRDDELNAEISDNLKYLNKYIELAVDEMQIIGVNYEK